MNDVARILDFWPLNAGWYWQAMAAAFVLIVTTHVLLGVLRRRAEQRPKPSRGVSTGTIRRLRNGR